MDLSVKKIRHDKWLFSKVFFPFIHDFTAIKGGKEFARSHKETNPPELKGEYRFLAFLIWELKLLIKNLIFNFIISEMVSHFQLLECYMWVLNLEYSLIVAQLSGYL